MKERALHLFVLWTFAVVEPLLDLLGRTPEFFVVRGSRPIDLFVLAFGLTLVPPLLLAALVRFGGYPLHLVFVGILVAVFALQVVRDWSSSTVLVLALAAACGAGFAALYARARPARLFLTVLAPVPVIVLALFLARAPISGLEGTAKALPLPAPAASPPIVLVVLDEFPVTSLLSAPDQIDAARFPAFAELARHATWYRNVTSVHEHTTEAVPAILTGQYPRAGELPLAADHPDNLFTLLASRYRLHVFESVTQLCPHTMCSKHTDSFGERLRSLGSDLKVVYGHLVLPPALEHRLPSVTETWQNFDGLAHDDAASVQRGVLALKNAHEVDAEIGRDMWQDQRFLWENWLAGVTPSPRPTLHAIHLLMPHYPWRYLPSGRQYGNSLGIDGLSGDTWSADSWLVEQGWQRHLLQVGFTDRLLGELIAKLKRNGMWNRSLVAVIADHGSSFVAGEHRRSITHANLPDIAGIPLFVKYPGERSGRIDRRNAESVDVVPTIADVLEIRLPYHADGISLLAGRSHGEVTVRGRQGEFVTGRPSQVEAGQRRTIARQVRAFGTGGWDGVYAIGPNRGLLGKPVLSLPVTQGRASASIDGQSLYAAVDPSSLLSPEHVTGRVSGASGPLDLAIGVNGRIAAVTRTFEVDGVTHFASFAPASAFRRGENSVEVYAVKGAGLEHLRGGTGAAAYALGRLRVDPSALAGRVEDWYVERSTVRFGGWAGDARTHGLVDAVAVFAGDRFLFAGATTVARRINQLDAHRAMRSGFVFEIPKSLLGKDERLHFYAVRGSVATELPAPKGFPW